MNPILWMRSVHHTRPSQLVERARRNLRNYWHDLAPSWNARDFRGSTPRARVDAPRAVFGARCGRAVAAPEGPRARFLNVEHPLSAPIDWRVPGRPQLERITLHYREVLEALDDATFVGVVEDWIAANRFGLRGSWRAGWNTYALSLRVVVWMQQLAARRRHLSETVVGRMHASLAEQLRYLEARPELDLGGNHLLKDAKALLWGGRYFEGPEARSWSESAQRILLTELDEQVLDDGMHFERSPAYHAQVFADLLECAHVADGSLRERLLECLAPMAQVLVDLTHPDGGPSLFNDGGMTMSYSTRECLDAYRSVTGRDAPAPRECIELASAGYYGLRSGESVFLFDCGAIAPDHLPAHGHGDLLSFEWSVEGRRFVVDAGVFEYERGARRDLARSTTAHNTVTLDDRDQCEFWSSFRVGRRARATLERFERLGKGFVLEGSHDGYAHLAGRPVHARRVIVGPSSLVVDDTLRGGARQATRARMLLHPDVEVTRCTRHSLRLRHGPVELELEARHPLQVVDALWFPDFGVERATKQLVLIYPPAPSRGGFRMQRVLAAAQAPALEGLRRAG